MRRPGLWHGLTEDILQFQGQAADHSDFHTFRSLLFYSNGFDFASHTYVSLLQLRG